MVNRSNILFGIIIITVILMGTLAVCSFIILAFRMVISFI